MPPASPKGQLPFIDDGGEAVADSTFIHAHIERRYGFDFDAGLSLTERAQAWAFERMIEHHVYWALVGARWVDEANFAKGPAHFFDGAPEHMREKLREDAQFRVVDFPKIGLAAADRMLAAGEFYTGTTRRLKRICP